MGCPRPIDDPIVKEQLIRSIMRPDHPLVSEVSEVEAKTLVTKYPSDNHPFGTLYNINLYRGCGHGCIYCDTRSECYGIIDISRIAVKKNAITLLRTELSHKREKGVVGTGSMNDPYMPIEAEKQLTRQALEVIAALGFGVHIITKSALVTRDIDLLVKLKQTHAVVSFSITTTNDSLAKQLEPGASPPSVRLEAMATLRQAGVHTGALLMPLLPGLTDTEDNMSGLVDALQAHGAEYAMPGCLTLRDTGRAFFYSRLACISPRALDLTRQIYSSRYLPPENYAHSLYTRVNKLLKKTGLANEPPKWRQEETKVQQLSLW
jgi:DNA repair photolyase